MPSSPLILVVAIVWIGFILCLGLLFWSNLVKNSKRSRTIRAISPGKTPEDILRHVEDQEMGARGQQVRERVQPMLPQLGLGSICLVLFITIVYFSQGS